MCEFVGWCAFLSVQWFQVWGSIIGAALGAGLAFGLAVSFQQRAERRRAQRYIATVRTFVRRAHVMAHALIEDVNKELSQLVDFDENVDELRRDAALFSRLSPFGEVLDPQVAAELIDLTAVIETFVTLRDKLDPTVRIYQSERARLNNALARISDACETVLETMGFGRTNPGG